MPTEKDLRLSKRISIFLKGNYRVGVSDFPFSVMTIVNISDQGICIATAEKLEHPSTVELDIHLADNQRVLLFAKAIRSTQLRDTNLFRTGLKILNTESEDFKKFKAFYEDRLHFPPKAEIM